MLKHIISNRRKALRPAELGRPCSSGNRNLSTDWSLTADSFERFLCWLSPNREEAGWEYEQLRNKLVKLFTWRGCPVPEELFDETVNRVAKKIALGTAACSGRKVAYCYGVARLVLLEYWRKAKPEPMPENVPAPSIPQPEWDETELESLSQCLDQLSARDRDLITRYYQGEGREKIEIRKEMACEGGGATALRIRIFRIRATLRDRISECVRREGGKRQVLAERNCILRVPRTMKACGNVAAASFAGRTLELSEHPEMFSRKYHVAAGQAQEGSSRRTGSTIKG